MFHRIPSLTVAIAFLMGVSACNDVPGPVAPDFDTVQSSPTTTAFQGRGGGGKGKQRGRPPSDEPTDPVSSVIELLDRDRPLQRNITVTATVTPLGGHIKIPEAGFDLKVPEGALPHSTEITVTALKGNKVAYEFGPHGLRFNRPVEFRQEMSRTKIDRLIEAWGLGQEFKSGGGYLVPPDRLWGIYYQGTPKSFVPLEFHRVVLKNFWITFEFDHFSGYALASG